MATTQIEESALTELREKAGRVTALESERDTAVQERDAAKRDAAESKAQVAAEKFARARVLEANQALPATTVDRIVREAVRDVPLTAEHALDEAKFATAVDAAKTAEESYLAGLAEAAGAGSIRGFGASTPVDGEVSESDFDATFNTSKEA